MCDSCGDRETRGGGDRWSQDTGERGMGGNPADLLLRSRVLNVGNGCSI